MADGSKKEVEAVVGLEGRAYEALEKDFNEVGSPGAACWAPPS
jgi:hypothetical protein